MSFFGNVDFFVKVALGQIPGFARDIIVGRNSDIDTGSTPEDIWSVGGLWVPPTTARIHDLVSTSAADTAAGSGAQEVIVIALNATFSKFTELVVMNGKTNVPMVTPCTRINELIVTKAGSDVSKANLGTITATAQTDATITNQIEIGESVAMSTVFTIPSGVTALLTAIAVTINNTGVSSAQANAQMSFITQSPIDVATAPKRKGIFFQPTVSGTSYLSEALITTPSVLSEKTDIRIRVETVSDNDTDVTGAYSLILIDNSVI